MVRTGNVHAFEILFNEYYEPLYRFACRFVGDPQTAENITQDIFVKLWESRSSIKISTNVKAYLFTSVRNHSLNYIKREKFVTSYDSEDEAIIDEDSSVDNSIIQEEIYEAVHKAINKLPEQCREIYLMNRYDELSYQEIADIRKISINTVKTQMKRALKSLRENLSHFKFLLLAVINFAAHFLKNIFN